MLPADPTDQLELAHRIANVAFVGKVQQLERENAQLQQQAMDRQAKIKQLERRINGMEAELADAADKVRLAMEDQNKLVGEKNALIQTVKKLNRDVAKLDNFKRNLMQTLQDDDEPANNIGGGSDAAGDRLVSSVLSGVAGGGVGTSGGGAGSRLEYGSPAHGYSPAGGGGYGSANRTPAMSPGLGAPRGGGGVGGGGIGAAESPSEGSKVDGKEFFRQARARLSYENFSQFLQNIKELNAHKQTRQETLAKAAAIFGDENGDLYGTFETLLVKHLPK